MTYLSYGIFCLFFGFVRLFFILGELYADFYDFYTVLGYILGIIGIIFWVYMIETYMLLKKTKRICTILLFISGIIAFITLIGGFNRYIALITIMVTLTITAAMILLLFIFIIINSKGTTRLKAILLFLAVALLFIGHAMDSEWFSTNFPDVPNLIAALIMIGGIVVFTSFLFFVKQDETDNSY